MRNPLNMFRSKKSLAECAPALPLPMLLQRTRIIVIDDVETEFPFGILRDQGYSIDYWPDVKDLARLDSGFYDIIVLDIGGVGRQLDDTNEGVAVLKHLKKINPSQVVIAYSGQSHDSRRIPFFRLADQYVPKPTNAITWKEILDDMIKSRMTVSHLWSALQQMLKAQGVSQRQISKFESELVSHVGDSAVDATSLVTKYLGTVDRLVTVASIVGKILLLCSS